MPGPLTISQMTTFPGSPGGTELFPMVATSANGQITNYRITFNQISVAVLAGLGSQTANSVFAGPASGASGAPAFRSLVVADIPNGTPGQLLIGQASTVSWITVNKDLTMAASGSATVVGLQGNPVFSTAPSGNQVLAWNGSGWAPLTATTFVSNVASGWGLTGGPITGTGALSVATVNPPYSFTVPVNLSLAANTSGNILNISALANNGATASIGNPILIPFLSTAVATGTPIWVPITSALSISTFSTGATFGAGNNVPFRLWVVALYNGGSPLLGLINCSTTSQIFPLPVQATVNASSIGSTATAAGTIYTVNGTTITNSPFSILGFVSYEAGLVTAGTFNASPTAIRLFGPGVPMPGQPLQVTQALTTTADVGVALTTYQVYSTFFCSIAPSSAINGVRFEGTANLQLTSGTAGTTVAAYCQMTRGNATTFPKGAQGVLKAFNQTAIYQDNPSFLGIDFPATTTVTNYYFMRKVSSTIATAFMPAPSDGTAILASMMLTEIMA